MNVMILQVFVSLMLVLGAVVLFVFTVRARTFEHSDRLALKPLEEDTIHPTHSGIASSSPTPSQKEQ